MHRLFRYPINEAVLVERVERGVK